MNIELKEKLYTSTQVADILGVSLRTLYRYMEDGKIQSMRTASGRHRFTRDHILEFLNGGASETFNSTDQSINIRSQSNIDTIRDTRTGINDFLKPDENQVYNNSNQNIRGLGDLNINDNVGQSFSQNQDFNHSQMHVSSGPGMQNHRSISDTATNQFSATYDSIKREPVLGDDKISDQNTSSTKVMNTSRVDDFPPSGRSSNMYTHKSQNLETWTDDEKIGANPGGVNQTKVGNSNQPNNLTAKRSSFDFYDDADTFSFNKQVRTEAKIIDEPKSEPNNASFIRGMKEQIHDKRPQTIEGNQENTEDNKSTDSIVFDNNFGSKKYYKTEISDLIEIAKRIRDVGTQNDVDYAFTLYAGLSLHFDVNPFDSLHIYINPEDIGLWKNALKLTESDKSSADIVFYINSDIIFVPTKTIGGFRVVEDKVLLQDLSKEEAYELVKRFRGHISGI